MVYRSKLDQSERYTNTYLIRLALHKNYYVCFHSQNNNITSQYSNNAPQYL